MAFWTSRVPAFSEAMRRCSEGMQEPSFVTGFPRRRPLFSCNTNALRRRCLLCGRYAVSSAVESSADAGRTRYGRSPKKSKPLISQGFLRGVGVMDYDGWRRAEDSNCLREHLQILPLIRHVPLPLYRLLYGCDVCWDSCSIPRRPHYTPQNAPSFWKRYKSSSLRKVTA